MKKITITLLFVFIVTTAQAKSVYCTNCSTTMMQAIEKAQSADQLRTLLKKYDESLTQTAQQIRLVQQNIEQYENMLQNTAQLPADLKSGLKGNMTRLASLSSELRVQRGDMTSLGEIFTTLYPDQPMFDDLAGASPEQMSAATGLYRNHWDEWSKNVDRSSQATFQLSGQQLDDLQKDPEQFQDYLDKLLETPEGQMQAIQSGNQLAAIQVQEARQLRELMATTVQSDLQGKMKSDKEGQMSESLWREMSKSEQLKNLTSKPDPF